MNRRTFGIKSALTEQNTVIFRNLREPGRIVSSLTTNVSVCSRMIKHAKFNDTYESLIYGVLNINSESKNDGQKRWN